VSKKSFIDSVKVGSACGEKWEHMAGNDRVRFCSHCSKSVNNLSEMTRKQAARLVRASDGKICIRYVVDPVTRRPVFAEQLLQITRRAPGLAAGVMTASMSLSTAAYSQGETVSSPAAVPVTVVRADQYRKVETTAAGLKNLTGTVTDPNGAVIVNAVVNLYEGETITRTASTDQEGIYRFYDVPAGSYRLETTSPGFRTSQAGVDVSTGTATVADTSLSIGIQETVEVRADVQLDVSGLTSVTVGGSMAVIEYTSALSRAVADEDKELIRDLLAKGAKVNTREESYSKITPIFLAVETGDLEIVQMLLDAGAKVKVRSASKETPLMRLDQDATAELVELLVRYGARVNAADEDGRTALLHAVEYSTPTAAQALIAAGADVNAADNEGVTALMKAADRGDIDTARALIAAGAYVNARDKQGDNAWVYTDDSEIEDLLLSFGIEITAEQRAKRDGTAGTAEITPEATPETTPEPVPVATPPV
jgi:hypothetical protein